MTEYSVADAKNGLPGLIDRAQAGEHVVITRHGRPVAELRAISAPRRGEGRSYAWLKSQRDKRKSVGISSVTLLRSIYDDES